MTRCFNHKLEKERRGKTVVVLVNEVQNNFTGRLWPVILACVCRVGIFSLNGTSPQFDKNNRSQMLLSIEDLPEIYHRFEQIVSFRSDNICRAANQLLYFTMGHFVPFVSFTTRVLDLTNKIDLCDVNSYKYSKRL